MLFTEKYEEYTNNLSSIRGVLDLLTEEELLEMKKDLGIDFYVDEGLKDFFIKMGTKLKSSMSKIKDWVKNLFSGKFARVQKRIQEVTGKEYPKEEIGAIMRLNPEHTKSVIYESFQEEGKELVEIVYYDQSASTVKTNKFDRWADWISYILDKLHEYCRISNDKPFEVLTTKNKLQMFRKWRIQKYGQHQYEKQYSLDKV